MRPTVRRYVRYEHRGTISYGVLDGDGSGIAPIQGSLFGGLKETGAKIERQAVRLLWPCEPSKILAVGLNYKSHLGDRPAPVRPELFWKPTSCLVEPGGKIVIPEGANNVHYEGELVVVIGKRGRDISMEKAKEHVFGYTVGNDVTAREMQAIDRATIGGGLVPALTLMESAGQAAAREARAMLGDAPGPVEILCGKGNNGGDGLVVARALAEHGLPVTVHLTHPGAELSADARANLERLAGLPPEVPGSASMLTSPTRTDLTRRQ